ncbi:MAG TPA: hypothetical protein VND94_14175 [Terriglobia bacterium]|nr:hypothetical protein [Terriglobia bacterium]
MSHVMIGTPTLDGSVHVAYLQSLLGTQKLLLEGRQRFSMRFIMQESLIMRARNLLVADFLDTDAEDLIMIDSDIGWTPADVMRLLRYDVGVVAGVYQRKSDVKVDFTVKFPPDGVQRNKQTGLMKAERVGTGFLRLRRDALERMIAKYPDLQYRDASGRELYCLFDTSLENGRFCGEDFTFCDRWRAIGGEVWVDPDIRLSHIGSKVFDKSLWEALQPAAAKA